jgi:spermidine/putrescine-binding protein
MVKETKVVGSLLEYLHNHVKVINDSKIFAGLMIITLNIASKFVTIKLSKTMESYLKYTFSRDILVFAITWMGTRDIYIATFITLFFILFMDFLLNEDSMFCILPEQFTNYHISLAENFESPTPDEIKKAEEVLERAKKQQNALTKENQYQSFMSY